MRAPRILAQLAVIGRKTLGRALRRPATVPKFEVVSAPSAGRCAFSEAAEDETESDCEIVLLRGSCFSDLACDGDGDDASDCATIVADSVYDTSAGAGTGVDAHAKRADVKGADVFASSHPQALAAIATLQREAQPHVSAEADNALFDGIQPAFLTLMHCGGTASRRRRVRAFAETMDLQTRV